eukprot:3416554-Rhodomonas_salina.1
MHNFDKLSGFQCYTESLLRSMIDGIKRAPHLKSVVGHALDEFPDLNEELVHICREKAIVLIAIDT